MDKAEIQEIARKNTRQGIGCCAAAVIGLLILSLLVQQIVPGGAGGTRAYEGPVLPMLVLSGGEGLTAQRNVDFDFAPYGIAVGSFIDPNEAVITDTYLLTNSGASELTAELAYPFVGSYRMEARFFPAVTVEGEAADTKLVAAVDPGETVQSSDNWREFREALLARDHLGNALAPAAGEALPVIVYEITDLHSETVGERYLAAEFTADPDRTVIWNFGSIGMVDDEEAGTFARVIHIPSEEEPWVMDRGYLVVVGGDIDNLTLTGYDSYDLTQEHRIDGVSGQLRRYESTLSEVLGTLAQYYVNFPYHQTNSPWQVLCEGALKRLADPDYHTTATAYRSLNDLFSAVLNERVMMYQIVSLTLAPGQSIRVSAQFRQQASRDAIGLGTPADGFELATRLGSSLRFEGQSASLTNSHRIEIVDQNFGFDPAAGVTEVTLDLKIERYYLTVRSVS